MEAVHKMVWFCGRRPQNRPDLRINPEKTSTYPQKRPVLRIKVGKTVLRPHLGPILRIDWVAVAAPGPSPAQTAP